MGEVLLDMQGRRGNKQDQLEMQQGANGNGAGGGRVSPKRPIMPTPSVVIETTDTTGATSIFRQSSNDIEDDRLKEDDDNDQRSSSSSSSSSSSCSGGSGGGGGGGDAARSKGGRHSIVGTKVLWPCKGMTDFHFSLMVGVIVFLIFWILLLLRIYMPELYLDEEDLKEKVDENLAS